MGFLQPQLCSSHNQCGVIDDTDDKVWLELPTTTTQNHQITAAYILVALQLVPSQREQTQAMLLRELPNNEVAETVGCNERAVRRIR